MDEAKCPHCGSIMHYNLVIEDWECHECGYISLIPEDPMDYVLPPGVIGGIGNG